MPMQAGMKCGFGSEHKNPKLFSLGRLSQDFGLQKGCLLPLWNNNMTHFNTFATMNATPNERQRKCSIWMNPGAAPVELGADLVKLGAVDEWMNL